MQSTYVTSIVVAICETVRLSSARFAERENVFRDASAHPLVKYIVHTLYSGEGEERRRGEEGEGWERMMGGDERRKKVGEGEENRDGKVRGRIQGWRMEEMRERVVEQKRRGRSYYK